MCIIAMPEFLRADGSMLNGLSNYVQYVQFEISVSRAIDPSMRLPVSLVDVHLDLSLSLSPTEKFFLTDHERGRKSTFKEVRNSDQKDVANEPDQEEGKIRRVFHRSEWYVSEGEE
jgi:hypothetical protein